MYLIPSASVDATSHIPEGRCTLSYAQINVDEIINSVRDDGAGATAVFVGEFRRIGFLTLGSTIMIGKQEQRATLSKGKR